MATAEKTMFQTVGLNQPNKNLNPSPEDREQMTSQVWFGFVVTS